jgi:hypothetical protein
MVFFARDLMTEKRKYDLEKPMGKEFLRENVNHEDFVGFFGILIEVCWR